MWKSSNKEQMSSSPLTFYECHLFPASIVYLYFLLTQNSVKQINQAFFFLLFAKSYIWRKLEILHNKSDILCFWNILRAILIILRFLKLERKKIKAKNDASIFCSSFPSWFLRWSEERKMEKLKLMMTVLHWKKCLTILHFCFFFFISSFVLAFVYLVFPPQEKRNKFIKNGKKKHSNSTPTNKAKS